MAGIPALVAKITAALAMSKVRFGGTGGIGAMLSDATELIKDRGVMNVEDASTLQLMTGADGGLAIVANSGLYRYNPTSDATPTTDDIPAPGGGRWEKLTSLGKQKHTEVIGDSTTEVFTLVHDLNTLTPNVRVLETLGGLPYSYNTDGIVAVVDANTVSITYETPPGSFQFTVAITV